MPGDGVGLIIMKQVLRVLDTLMKDEIASGKLEVREIEGVAIENCAVTMQRLPDTVLEEVKVVLTTLDKDASTEEYMDYLMETIEKIKRGK